MPRLTVTMALIALACTTWIAKDASAGQQGAAADSVSRYLDSLSSSGDLRAARDAPVVTWLSQVQGRKSLWIADGPDLRARELYTYGEDDGLPITRLTVSADGHWLVYVRGSWPNAQGAIGNPNDRAEPQERALWIISTSGGVPRQVATGASPAIHVPTISPDSRTIAYARGSEVWLTGTAQGDPQRAFTIRGFVAALAWSPDGRHIAFVSERGTHSFVGVFTLESRAIRYLEPGLDRDAELAWSPDGRWLAFVRTREEVQTYRFTPRREGIPWSIVAANTADWTVRTVWTADPGDGSVYSGFASNASSGAGPAGNQTSLNWLDGQTLMFPWERSGYRHLYRVSVSGGRAVSVTGGTGEVTNATVSADGRAVVFQTNADVRERFDLSRVVLVNGKVERIWSQGTPYDEPAVLLPNGSVVFVGESSREPRRVMTKSGSAQPRALQPAWPAFTSDEAVEPVAVELTAEDGVISRGLLYKPLRHHGRHGFPALVWAHGGPEDIALPGVGKYDSRWVQAAVRSGYVVLAVNYRGSLGYGLSFRKAAAAGGAGASDVRDVAAAGRYLAALPYVDAGRVGIFGQSYGGFLTTAALAKYPQLWSAGVSIVGVSDWQMEMELDDGGPLPFRVGARMQHEELAFESSANANLERWRAPILFISGDDDQAGWLAQAIQLGQVLRRRGIEVQAWVEPGGNHGGATHAQLVARMQRAMGFFDRHLAEP